MSMSISGGTGGSITPGSDTPKSDSSRSCESEQPATKIDFSSENNTTPVDIEASIQCERIMKVLDGLISRTKMALCIPTLVKDVKELRSVMTPEHLEDVLYIVGLYTTDHIAPSFHNGSSAANMHEITMENIALKKNPELAHLLFIINSYPELQLKIDEIILKMMAVQNAEKDPGLEYLLTLNQFRTLMLRQSTLTASDEIKMKLKVRKFEASNANLINDIQNSLRYLIINIYQGYMSGGAGYVLSREALYSFIYNALPSPHICKADPTGPEDVLMGICLANIGVKAMDSRDTFGRGRFFPFLPEGHLFPLQDKKFWYWHYIYYPSDEGLDCCSDYAVSFHYVPARKMYELDYLIYHLRPYGITHQHSANPPVIDHNIISTTNSSTVDAKSNKPSIQNLTVKRV